MLDKILEIKSALRNIADTMYNKTHAEVHTELLLLVNQCEKIVDDEIDAQAKITNENSNTASQRVLP